MTENYLFCKSLPKVVSNTIFLCHSFNLFSALDKQELHAHMNGSISNKTIHKLLERKKSLNQLEEFPEALLIIEKGDKRTLAE